MKCNNISIKLWLVPFKVDLVADELHDFVFHLIVLGHVYVYCTGVMHGQHCQTFHGG